MPETSRVKPSRFARTRFDPHPDPAVALLLDRAAVRDVILRYAHCVDQCDFEQLASCFTPDVSGKFGGQERVDRDGLIAFISGVAGFKSTLHMMGNSFVEIDGDDAALESYAMVMHLGARDDGTPWRFDLTDSVYAERLVRTAEGWTIRKRAADPVWAPRGVTGLRSDDPAVQWLLDRASLFDATMQCALAIDRREPNRLRKLVAPSFCARDPRREFANLDDFLAELERLETFESTTHFVGTPLIEVEGDRAWVRAPVFVTKRREGERLNRVPESATTACYFRDHWERANQVWQLTRREISLAAPAAGSATDSATDSPHTSHDPLVQSLLGRAALSDLVTQTAVGLDCRDFQRVGACFRPDETAFVEEQVGELAPFHQTTHLVGNHLVTLDGNRARAQTYVYRTQQTQPDGPASHWGRGARHWDDEFECGPDGWRIRKREVQVCPVDEPAVR